MTSVPIELPGPDATIDVNEIFGPVFQGEGPSTGRRCGFVRLARCNLDCGEGSGATWCCFAPNTPVLMADWTSKPIQDVRPGDLVMAYGKRSYTVARVSDTSRHDASERVTVQVGGSTITCTPDHEWYVQYSRNPKGGTTARADDLAGRPARWSKLGAWAPDEERRTDGWCRGYLMGAVLGDGHVRAVPRRSTHTGHPIKPRAVVRVQTVDREFAAMCCEAARRVAGRTAVVDRLAPTRSGRPTFGWSTTVGESLAFILDSPGDKDEARGFVAGMFDAEGSIGGRGTQLNISQLDPKPLRRIADILRGFGFGPTLASKGRGMNALLVNGLDNVDRFMDLFRPAITRKREKHRSDLNRLLGSHVVDAVTEAEPGVVHNLTTTTGNYFAGGYLVANCDTPYTWRWDGQFDNRRSTFDPAVEVRQRTVRSVADEVARMDVPLCVITGGEPLSQRGKVGALARLLHPWVGCEVETNGTVNPGPAATHVEAFNVSPKLANSGVAFEKRYKPAVLRNLTHTGKARFKFVCSSVADLDEVDWIVSDAELPAGSVWVMPAGTDAATIAARLEALADAVVRRGYNLSGRLHVTVYGDRRGV